MFAGSVGQRTFANRRQRQPMMRVAKCRCVDVNKGKNVYDVASRRLAMS